MRKLLFPLVSLPLLSLALASVSFGQIAITEFESNPTNTATLDFVELYNFSSNSVLLTGWTIATEGGTQVTISALTLASGEYAIFTRNKNDFQTNWFGGTATTNVFGNGNVNIATGGNVITVKDPNSSYSWSAPKIAAVGTTSFVLASSFDFSTVVANAANTIVSTSYVQSANGVNGAFTGANTDIASPLAGGYSAIPEPSTFAFLAGGLALCGVALRRRR